MKIIPKHLGRLPQLSSIELKLLFTKYYGEQHRTRFSKDFLIGNISWAIQAKQHDLNYKQLRKKLTNQAKKKTVSRKTQYLPGTRLVREWGGNTNEVVVNEKGFTWNEKQYQTLSEIAREITGARWSGPRFFGLKK